MSQLDNKLHSYVNFTHINLCNRHNSPVEKVSIIIPFTDEETEALGE